MWFSKKRNIALILGILAAVGLIAAALYTAALAARTTQNALAPPRKPLDPEGEPNGSAATG
jgi:hypothetical protein